MSMSGRGYPSLSIRFPCIPGPLFSWNWEDYPTPTTKFPLALDPNPDIGSSSSVTKPGCGSMMKDSNRRISENRKDKKLTVRDSKIASISASRASFCFESERALSLAECPFSRTIASNNNNLLTM